jgi:plastocyanin domain-containing protein
MKATAISIIVSGLLIAGAILLVGSGKTSENNTQADNVSVVDGRQIIEIGAKGGYEPKVSVAKADIPTILRVQTRGTFDCSSALTIPSVGYKGNLPPSGVTEIEVPAQESGTTLQGLCAMGMYNFKVQFN